MSLSGHAATIDAVAIDPSDQFVVAGASSGLLKLWDLEHCKVIRTLAAHKTHVNALEFYPFGDNFASASSDGSVHVWDMHAKGPAMSFVHASPSSSLTPVRHVRMSPDGMWMATSAGDDRLVKLWDLKSGRLLHCFSHTSASTSASLVGIEFHPRECLMATASDDGAVTVWDMDNNFSQLSSSSASVSALASAIQCRGIRFTPDGSNLAMATDAGVSAYACEPFAFLGTTQVPTVPWSRTAVADIHMGQSSSTVHVVGLAESMASIWSLELTTSTAQTTPSAVQQGNYLSSRLAAVQGSTPRLSGDMENGSRQGLHLAPVTGLSSKLDEADGGVTPRASQFSSPQPSSNALYPTAPPLPPIQPSNSSSSSSLSTSSTSSLLSATIVPTHQQPPAPTNRVLSRVNTPKGLGRVLSQPNMRISPDGSPVPFEPDRPAINPLRTSSSHTALQPLPPVGSSSPSIPQAPPQDKVDHRSQGQLTKSQSMASMRTADSSMTDDLNQRHHNVAQMILREQHAHAERSTEDADPDSTPKTSSRHATPLPRPKSRPMSRAGSSSQVQSSTTQVFGTPLASPFVKTSGESLLGIDLAKFLPPGHPSARSPVPTLTSSNSLSLDPSSWIQSHNVVSIILDARIRTMTAVLDRWSGGSIMSSDPSSQSVRAAAQHLVSATPQPPDPAVCIDFLRALNLRPALYSLDVCVAILPLLTELLFGIYEEYLITACTTVKTILHTFAPVIVTNLQAANVPTAGIDISREERIEKCRRCFADLGIIQAQLSEMKLAPGKLGAAIRDALQGYSAFDVLAKT
ncbi:hypothetical protein RI367_004018 [Sorochytrium milnesiophthora]